MKKQKARISIKFLILLPVICLGLVAILSSATGLSGIKTFNKSAQIIADKDMVSIQKMSELQSAMQNIHKLALSHIIATDFNTMIEVVDTIKVKEAELDQMLVEYEPYISEENRAEFDTVVTAYDNLKHALVFLVAYSANGKNTEAYSCANGDVATYANQIQQSLNHMMEVTTEDAARSRESLEKIYQGLSITNTIIIVVSVVAMVLAILCVILRIINPMLGAQKKLRDIIDGIDKEAGDLTQRIDIVSNDEISDLGDGINKFIEKLQDIMRIIIDNSQKMKVVVDEVLQSVITSNDNASDLSALTEELAATMQEVANSVTAINKSTETVHSEVEEIADKSNGINEYSKEMKTHAEEMENAARENKEQTSIKVNEILDVLNQAIEESKSVDQVNNLTNDILSISSQTNLLALNASIEAARAGEAGKGFAVVAEEIRQLADSSRETANKIQDINAGVTQAVYNLADNANNLVNYMTEEILPEFDTFVNGGVQYKEDATHIESIMNEFNSKTASLRQSMSEIAESINTITSAIEEGVKGVTGAADNTQALVEDINNISVKMDENQQIAGELEKGVAVFKHF